MKVVVYNGIIDPTKFEIVEVTTIENTLGLNIVGFIPEDKPTNTDDAVYESVVTRIKSRIGS